jgi:hypothetical protein
MHAYKSCMCRAYTKVMLASLACTDMTLKTQMIERLSTSHMLIVIGNTQSTFVAIPLAVTTEDGVVN